MSETPSKSGLWKQLDAVSKRTLLYSSTIATVVALWKMLSPPIILVLAVWYVVTGAIELIWLSRRPAKPTFTLGHFLNGCILLSITFMFCAQLVFAILGPLLRSSAEHAQRTEVVALFLFGVAAYEWAILTMGGFVRTIIAGSAEAPGAVAQPKKS